MHACSRLCPAALPPADQATCFGQEATTGHQQAQRDLHTLAAKLAAAEKAAAAEAEQLRQEVGELAAVHGLDLDLDLKTLTGSILDLRGKALRICVQNQGFRVRRS